MRISDWSSDVCSSDLPDPPRSAGPRPHLPPRCPPPARRRGMDPPLRTLLEPEARCPRGPAPHRRRPPRQDRQARRPPRAQQEEEEEMNATISPAKADYAVLSDTDTVRLQRVLPRSEEHTSELQSLMRISYAVFCLKK